MIVPLAVTQRPGGQGFDALETLLPIGLYGGGDYTLADGKTWGEYSHILVVMSVSPLDCYAHTCFDPTALIGAVNGPYFIGRKRPFNLAIIMPDGLASGNYTVYAGYPGSGIRSIYGVPI